MSYAKKMFGKKVCAFVISLIMVLGLATPFGGIAAEAEGHVVDALLLAMEESIPDSDTESMEYTPDEDESYLGDIYYVDYDDCERCVSFDCREYVDCGHEATDNYCTEESLEYVDALGIFEAFDLGTSTVLTGTPFSNDGSSNPAYAFDGDVGNPWLANRPGNYGAGPGFIGLDFGGDDYFRLTAVRYHPVVGDTDDWHTAAFVQGSNDTVNWVNLTGEGDDADSYWTRNAGALQDWDVLYISDNTPFKYFRLAGGSTHDIWLRFGEIQFIGYMIDDNCNDCGICDECNPPSTGPGVLTGTPFGNDGASNIAAAFDNDIDTAFLSNTSAATHSGAYGYIGLMLDGDAFYRLTAVRYHPVVGDMDDWHTAAHVQGSADGITWVNLVGVGDDAGGYWTRNVGVSQTWATLSISDDTPYKHFRLAGGPTHDILIRFAEIEFIGYAIGSGNGGEPDCGICGTCADCLLVVGENRIQNGDMSSQFGWPPIAHNWRQEGFIWGGYDPNQGHYVIGEFPGSNYTTGYTITLEPGVYRLSIRIAPWQVGEDMVVYLRDYTTGIAIPNVELIIPGGPHDIWQYAYTTFEVTTELTNLQLHVSRPGVERGFWQGPTTLQRIGGDPEPERPPDSNVDGDLIFHLNNDSLFDTWFGFGNNPDVGVAVSRPSNVYYGLGALRVTTSNGHGGFEIHFYHAAPWMANLTLEPNRHYRVTGVTRVTGMAYDDVHVGMFHRNALAFFETPQYPFNVLPMGDDWTEFEFDVITQPNHSGGFGFVMRGNNLTSGAFYFANMRVYDLGSLGLIECAECGEYENYCICCIDCEKYPCECPPTDWNVEFIFGNIFNEGDASVANSFNNGGWAYSGVTVTNEGRGNNENTLRLDGFVGYHPLALEPNTEYRVRVFARNAEPGALVGPQRPLPGDNTDAGHNKISFQYNSASEDAEGFTGDRHNMYITSTDFEWIEMTFTTPADMQPMWHGAPMVVFAMRASTAWIQEFIVERVADGESIFNNGEPDISEVRLNTWEGSFGPTRDGQGLPTNTVRIAPGGYGQVELPIESGRVYNVRVLARGNGTISLGGIYDIEIDTNEWGWHTTTLHVPFDFDDANAYIAMRASQTGTLWVEGVIVIDQNPPARPATIIVDPEVTFQEIEGMGFFGPEGVWWESWWRDMHSPEWIDKVLIDMGVTMWRNEVYSLLNPACGVGDNPHLNPNCSGSYFCCLSDTDRPLGNQDTWWPLQRPVVVDLWNRAQELEVDFRIILSAWSPPGQWKDNDTTKNGGTLLPQYYELYGHWWVAALDMYKAEGVEVYAISLQNEPMFAQGFSSMVITAEEYINMLLVAIPIIKAAHPDVLIFGAECMLGFQNGWAINSEFNFQHLMAQNLLNTNPGDPGSLHGIIDRFAVHGYYEGVFAEAVANHRNLWNLNTQNYGMLPNWMTETSGYGYHWLDQERTVNNWTRNIPGALNLGMAMHMALAYGNITAWVYWQGFNHETDSIYNIWSPYDNLNKFAVSQHFFRYLRPGTVRIAAEVIGTAAQDDLLVTAYRDDSYDRYVVIIVNSSEYPHEVSIEGFGNVGFRMYYTTADDDINFLEVDAVLRADNILIPAQSVVTLVACMQVLPCDECGYVDCDGDCDDTQMPCDICDDTDCDGNCDDTQMPCDICDDTDCDGDCDDTQMPCDICDDTDCDGDCNDTHVPCDICDDTDCDGNCDDTQMPCDICKMTPCVCGENGASTPQPPPISQLPPTVTPGADPARLLPLVPRATQQPIEPEDDAEDSTEDDEDENLADIPAGLRHIIRFVMDNLIYTINGMSHINDVTPFIDPAFDRVMIPLRAVSEALGAEVEWLPETRTVRIFTATGIQTLIVDVPLPDGMGTPIIVSNRVLVPLRFVAEHLGAEVRWDDVNRAAYVYID